MIYWTDGETGQHYVTQGRIPAVGDLVRMPDLSLRRVCDFHMSMEAGEKTIIQAEMRAADHDHALYHNDGPLSEAAWREAVAEAD